MKLKRSWLIIFALLNMLPLSSQTVNFTVIPRDSSKLVQKWIHAPVSRINKNDTCGLFDLFGKNKIDFACYKAEMVSQFHNLFILTNANKQKYLYFLNDRKVCFINARIISGRNYFIELTYDTASIRSYKDELLSKFLVQNPENINSIFFTPLITQIVYRDGRLQTTFKGAKQPIDQSILNNYKVINGTQNTAILKKRKTYYNLDSNGTISAIGKYKIVQCLNDTLLLFTTKHTTSIYNGNLNKIISKLDQNYLCDFNCSRYLAFSNHKGGFSFFDLKSNALLPAKVSTGKCDYVSSEIIVITHKKKIGFEWEYKFSLFNIYQNSIIPLPSTINPLDFFYDCLTRDLIFYSNEHYYILKPD